MRALDVALGGYALVCVLAITWPVFEWVASLAPTLVWGMPFALTWNIGWVVLTFVVLAAYHSARRG